MYSFGMLLYELVTGGKRPFEDLRFRNELDAAVMQGRMVDPITDYGCSPWPDVDDLIQHLLEPRADMRPTADQVKIVELGSLVLLSSFPFSNSYLHAPIFRSHFVNSSILAFIHCRSHLFIHSAIAPFFIKSQFSATFICSSNFSSSHRPLSPFHPFIDLIHPLFYSFFYWYLQVFERLSKAELLCLKRDIPVFKEQTVECMTIRKYEEDNQEMIEVWIGSGLCENNSGIVSWVNLTDRENEVNNWKRKKNTITAQRAKVRPYWMYSHTSTHGPFAAKPAFTCRIW